MHAARTLHSTRAEASCTQYLYRIVQTGPPEVGYDQRILSAAHSAAGRRRATIDTPAVVSRASEVSRDKRRSSLAPVSSGVTASHAYKYCTMCFHCLPRSSVTRAYFTIMCLCSTSAYFSPLCRLPLSLCAYSVLMDPVQGFSRELRQQSR